MNTAQQTRQTARTKESVATLLHEAAETHHGVFRITDGADDDWASWYADWLINLSELADVLAVRPVRSELVWLLVECDKTYTAEPRTQSWESFYADRLLAHFAS